MEYHADRFPDYSLLIFEDDSLVAVLPAHREVNSVYSHRGLTYGGFVLTRKSKLAGVIAILRAVMQFMESDGVEFFEVKSIPMIYHLLPSAETDYALIVAGATLERRDSLSVIDLQTPFKIAKTRMESVRRGHKNQLVIREDNNFDLFWNSVLIPNLKTKHNAKPVHSLEEITMLHRRFPKNIRHFNVYGENGIEAGTTVFVSENVAHPQYVSGRENKNETGALDYLYHHLITDVFRDKKYFDFGISNEENGMKLNGGLAFWKESFGARTITQDFYRLAVGNHDQLDTVIL
ncbi:MAG: GNAT family N-acetyltransferase [Flavobacterium sp.]|nr:GNAT family N-acetyltransferase [Flavobacterium sp.]